jgi:hypothetical protein
VIAEGLLNLPASDNWYVRWQVDDRNSRLAGARRWSGSAPPFFVVSSFGYERYLDHPLAVPDRTEFFRTVLNEFQIVQEFRPRWVSYGKHSPVIVIARPRLEDRAESCEDCRVSALSAQSAQSPGLPFGAIDAPAPGGRVGDMVELRGWAIGPGGIAEAHALLDGRPWLRLSITEARGDISRAYWPFSRGWDRHGWRGTAALPSSTTPGEHTLEVRVLSRRGAARTVGTVLIVVTRSP